MSNYGGPAPPVFEGLSGVDADLVLFVAKHKMDVEGALDACGPAGAAGSVRAGRVVDRC